MSVPPVSAKSWAIFDASSQALICGKQEAEPHEIASLTKIMTAYTAIHVASRLDINMLTSKVVVSYDASEMTGTTANLAAGDALSFWDMLHAMLLPSGNDAAYAIAEYVGYLLLEFGMPPFAKSSDPVSIFVAEMNRNAKQLHMTNTTYHNPHGLQDPLNVSSAGDVAKLAATVMGMPFFAEIVKKPRYACVGYDIAGQQKKRQWANTNRLLSKGFNGLKTGITPSAGPCLASSYHSGGVNLVIVVLGCKTPDHRWHEVMKLKDFAIRLAATVVGTDKDKGKEKGKSLQAKADHLKHKSLDK